MAAEIAAATVLGALIGSFLNRVYAQSPGGGSMQPKGTVITLTIV